MTSTIYAALDPGRLGAIAFIYPDGRVVIEDMPTAEEVVKRIGSIWSDTEDYRVAIEDVHPLPGQSCTATFSYGQNVMLAKMLGMCYNMHPVMVSPMKWKKFYGLKRAEDESKAAFKRRSVDLARELYPSAADLLKYSKDGRAEALLIAHWLKHNDTV